MPYSIVRWIRLTTAAAAVIGAKIRVDDASGELVLRGQSNSVIASLRPQGDDGSHVIVDGPGLDGPTCALLR